jgi:ABC-type amino acid transport substrate-binding protein
VGALLAAVALTGCASSSPAGGASGQRQKVLRIGSDLTYPPYDYMQGGAQAGFDPDFVRALTSQIGMKPQFQDTRFEQLIPNLNSGQFDVIASALYITAARAKQVDYIPYLTTGNSIVVGADAADQPSNISGLCGKKVGVIKGAAVAQSLRQEATGACKGSKPIDVREFPTDPEATQALLSNQVDAQVTDAAVAKSVIDKTAGKLKISSTGLLYPIPVGLAVKKGNTVLVKQLQQALDKLRASGKYQALLDQYNLKAPDPAQVAKILGS